MDSHQGSDAAVPSFTESSLEPSTLAAWRGWCAALRRRGLDGVALLLLEAGRPLALVSAQMLYMGAPFLGRSTRLLARLLESETETLRLIASLSSESGANTPARKDGT